MESYQVKNGVIPETLRVDDHPRSLFISWTDFQLLMEACHSYVNETVTRKPRKEILEVANRLTADWHKQDIEKVGFLRREWSYST